MLTRPEEVGFSSERLERVTAGIQAYIDRQELAGTVTAVMRAGKIAYFNCAGMANIEDERPMQRDTLFRIYSMTKPITSVAILMLFEAGCLRLTDPISRFIPAFDKKMQVLVQPDLRPETIDAKRPITIRDLLTHTAGFSYGFEDESYVDKLYREEAWAALDRNREQPPAQLMETIANLPLAHQPGSAFRYSLATDVLGYLVAEIAGMPFYDFLKTWIFNPLAMTDTFFYVPNEKRCRLAAVYNPSKNGVLEQVEPPSEEAFINPNCFQSGGGGLVSTASDYMHFSQMLLNRGELDGQRLLGRKSVELMTCNHLPPNVHPFDEPGFGFGLGVNVALDVAATQNLGSIGRYGWSGAASTNFWIDPQEHMVGLFLTQRLEDTTAVDDFRNLVYQALID